MVFLSLGLRFKANVEALNMAETIGNVTRHRRVPVIIGGDGGFRLIYVPAISGEALAHAYQANLVEVAKVLYDGKPPADPWSLRGEFVKFTDRAHLTDTLKQIITNIEKAVADKKKAKEKQEIIEKIIENGQHEFEKKAIEESIVADIGGFLYAEKPPVRRTSVFQVGYAVPVEEYIKATAIESQVHARQAIVGLITKAEEKEREEKQRQAQMLYYVEVASAIYGVTFNIDFDGIGRTSMVRVERVVDEDEWRRRVKAAIGALALTLGEALFGAKKSRFNPILEVLNAVVVLSHPLGFTVSPPQKKNYIAETILRAKKYKELLENIGIKEGYIKTATYGYKEYENNKESLEELFTWILRELGI